MENDSTTSSNPSPTTEPPRSPTTKVASSLTWESGGYHLTPSEIELLRADSREAAAEGEAYLKANPHLIP